MGVLAANEEKRAREAAKVLASGAVFDGGGGSANDAANNGCV
jgi:hypothetical protein